MKENTMKVGKIVTLTLMIMISAVIMIMIGSMNRVIHQKGLDNSEISVVLKEALLPIHINHHDLDDARSLIQDNY